jgi:large subunit ribosomal protein L13
MRTYQPKKKDVKRNWHLVDAKGQVLGRLASGVVSFLIGKNKVNYAPHMDMGDYVVVVNAKEIEITGRKRKQKVYQKHSGYPGGFKEIKFEKMISERPERVIELAVRRMLPDNRLRDKRMNRLKVFGDEKHPYENKLKA